MKLVTLLAAKRHLSVDHDMDDRLIYEKILSASDLIAQYVKVDTLATDFDWVDELGEPDNVPPLIQSAVLLVLGAMYENRDGSSMNSPQPLSQAVKDLLCGSRDPSMA